MIPVIKSAFASVATMVVLVSLFSNTSAQPQLISVTSFYGYQLNKPNPFDEHGIKITKSLGIEGGSEYALAKFSGHDIFLTCMLNYKKIKQLYDTLLDQTIKDDSGQEISPLPTLSFPIEKISTCYATKYQCERTIHGYGEELLGKYSVNHNSMDFLRNKWIYPYPKASESTEQKIEIVALKVLQKLTKFVLAMRELGWHVDRNLDSACINNDGESISFFKLTGAYRTDFSGVTNNRNDFIKIANGYTAGSLSSLFLPKDRQTIAKCIKGTSNNPTMRNKQALFCELSKHILIPQSNDQTAQ
ncbi:hypothetical protein BDF19DRAFT_430390 [Syncephalis fuscata]|nr:hypothetical protein BDF19DRAFT_430390 [Syncephalis fuscata]